MKKTFLFLICIITASTLLACQKPDEAASSPQKPAVSQKKEEKTINEKVEFFFPDDAVMYLCPETIQVKAKESEFFKSVVDAVIKGPSSDELLPSISGDVSVLSASLKDGVCIIDLSEEFSTFNTGGSTKETMAVYSLVNTLCSIDGVEKVKININGEENPDFGGHFDLSEPLEPDHSLLKK